MYFLSPSEFKSLAIQALAALDQRLKSVDQRTCLVHSPPWVHLHTLNSESQPLDSKVHFSPARKKGWGTYWSPHRLGLDTPLTNLKR